MGLIDRESADMITPDQFVAIGLFVRIAEFENLHDHSAGSEDAERMASQISELNDVLDLEDCDRVEEGKSFSRSGAEINIPVSLAPFMNDVVIPFLRTVLEKGS